jgi:hypothetical protein
MGALALFPLKADFACEKSTLRLVNYDDARKRVPMAK